MTTDTISQKKYTQIKTTAKKVAEILPFKSSFNTWGDEIYFSIPVEAELDDSAKEEVEIENIEVLSFSLCFTFDFQLQDCT